MVILGIVGSAGGAEIVLKDGRVLRGKLGKVASLADSPDTAHPDSGPALQLIVFLDDELRRTFVSDRLVHEVRQEESRQVDEKFGIRQRVLHSGSSIKSVGQPLKIEPFDEYGRRTFTMATGRGPVDVIQGITELTPQWTKVEGISHVWDMRMATSSIPPKTLHDILWKQINPKDAEHYKKVARFYLQCERYEDARQALEKLLAAMPNDPGLKEQLAPSLRAIAQLSAERLLAELKLRRDAGQHRLVAAKLQQFPTDGVGGEILQGVRDMMQTYATGAARRQEVIKQLKALAPGSRTPSSVKTSSRSSTKWRPRSTRTPWIAWRRFYKMPTMPKRPTPRKSPWPSAAGCWAPMRPQKSCRWRLLPIASAG